MLTKDTNLTDVGAKANPFRFEGFYYDSGVKSYDMRARLYKPDIGRFLAQDRFESARGDLNLQSDPLTQNRYAFAGGNPVNRIEFDGHVYSNEGGSSTAGNKEANEAQSVNKPKKSGRTNRSQPAKTSTYNPGPQNTRPDAGSAPAPAKAPADHSHSHAAPQPKAKPKPRKDRGAGDYLKNDVGGDLKGGFGNDLGIGDPSSKTYQDGEKRYSSPEGQAVIQIVFTRGRRAGGGGAKPVAPKPPSRGSNPNRSVGQKVKRELCKVGVLCALLGGGDKTPFPDGSPKTPPKGGGERVAPPRSRPGSKPPGDDD